MEELKEKIREAYQKAPYQILSTVQLAELGEFNHVVRLRREMYGDGSRLLCGSVGYSELTIAEVGEDGWLRPAEEKEGVVFIDAQTGGELSLSQAIQKVKDDFPVGIGGDERDKIAIELICYEEEEDEGKRINVDC